MFEKKSPEYKANVKALLETLKSLGVHAMHISFDGSGDSGSIDYISYMNKDGQHIRDARLQAEFMDWTQVHASYTQGQWTEEERVSRHSLYDASEQLAYDMLSETGIDWYNNDGGYGTIDIVLDPLSIEMEVNSRYTEVTTDSFSFEEGDL